MKKHNIILESNVEPKDKNVLWLQGNKLKKFGKTGWEDITEGGVVTTDRISDGAVTSEKISTSAFDSTLSVSGKIAPADVVGEKITKLNEKVDTLALGAFYGYFPDSISLPTDISTPGYAYVGLDNPYKIWNFNGESWSDSGTSIDMNDADEEDITRNTDGKLQLKDRVYGDGMGYVILRKDKSFAEQVTKENTIYEIRYDFILNEDITIPANCVLEFDGGSVNGTSTLTLNNCFLAGSPLITSNISGNVKNAKYYATWFGVKADGITDDSDAFQKAVSVLNNNILSIEDIKNNIVVNKSININIGSSQRSKHILGNSGLFGIKINNSYDVTTGAIFNLSESAIIIEGINFLGIENNKTQTAIKLSGRAQDISIKNCSFIYFDTAILYCTGACYNHIENCTIYYANYGFKKPYESDNYWAGAVDILNTKITGCSYGVYLSGYYSSISMVNGYLEGCKHKLYTSNENSTNSKAVFNNVYWGDQSKECIIINGGNISINGGSIISGSYTVEYAEQDKTLRRYTVVVNGGILVVNNQIISNSVNGEKSNACAISVTDNGKIKLHNTYFATQLSYGVAVIDVASEESMKYSDTMLSYTMDGIFSKSLPIKSSNDFYSGYNIQTDITVLQDKNMYGGNIVRIAKSSTNYYGVKIPFKVPKLGRYSLRYKIFVPAGTNCCINFNTSECTLSSDTTGLYYLSTKSWYGMGTLKGGNDQLDTDMIIEGSIPLDVISYNGYIYVNPPLAAALPAGSYMDIYYLCLVKSDDDAKIGYYQNAWLVDSIGSTTDRPKADTITVGHQYYDTTLNKPIWYNGAAWVDATGTQV